MPQKVNYYAVLARAVASLERDAYGARGAIYDREHRALLRRLALASPPCSEEEIAVEEQAFRDAVRRIEFPDHAAGEEAAEPRREFLPRRHQPGVQLQARRDFDQPRHDPRGSMRERPSARPREPAGSFDPAPANRFDRAPAKQFERESPAGYNRPMAPLEPQAARKHAMEEDRDLRASRPDSARAARAGPSQALPQADEDYGDGELETGEGATSPRSVLRRSLFATQITILLVGAGLLGYLAYRYSSGYIDLSSLFASAAPTQRAALYSTGQPNVTPAVGKATWRTRTDASSGAPAPAVVLETEIPERQIALTMTLSHEAKGGGMSHMFELQFADPDTLPFGGIASVPKIVMKDSETGLGDDLIGTNITVSPGSYLFGLLSTPDALARNVEALRMRPWMGIVINFADGSAQMLNVEKGASGKRTINEAFAKWGQAQ